jgi:hypothetical protein
MDEIVNRLQLAGFVDATMRGTEVHVTGPSGDRLFVSEYGDWYVVRAASADEVACVCRGAGEVVTQVRNWRR